MEYNYRDLVKFELINNALNDGWKIQKKNDKYIFSKHKGKVKEVYNEQFLHIFFDKYLRTK